MRERLANLISNLINPFLLVLAIIILLSFISAADQPEAWRWVFISTAIGVLPVLLVATYLVKRGRMDAIFTNIRRQRTGLYLLGSLCAVLGYLTLVSLEAPSMLVAAFAAGLIIALTFMCINLWWKISLHTALIAASATVLILLYGWAAVSSATLVPITAWARVELKCHSLAQATAGAFLATSIVVVIFYSFALV